MARSRKICRSALPGSARYTQARSAAAVAMAVGERESVGAAATLCWFDFLSALVSRVW